MIEAYIRFVEKLSMPTRLISLVGCMLLIAAIACNAPSPGSGGTTAAPAAATTAVTADVPTAVTPSITPTTAATVPPEGGFTSGTPLDVSTLPNFDILPMGMGPFLCGGNPSTPSVTLEEGSNNLTQLCIYNVPISEGSYSFTVRLIAPDNTEYTEVFTLGAIDTGVQVVDANNEIAGSAYSGADGFEVPFVSILLNTEANILVGTWQAEVSAPDAPGGAINIPLTPVTLGHSGPLASAIETVDGNPIRNADNAATTGETLHIFGTDYLPSTSMMVVFYYADPALPQTEFGTPTLRPLVGTTVSTDSQGKLTVDFVVGPSTPRGDYWVIIAPQITADYQFNPFTGGFKIE
jgi:hypothetical protein